jgi:alpha-tubulin suppressor-like RCC1 family protein
LSSYFGECRQNFIQKLLGAAYGALENGTMVTTSKPGKVKGLNYVVAISARENGGMTLCADRTVWAWGQNYKGQRGDGTSGNYSNVPVKTKSDRAKQSITFL